MNEATIVTGGSNGIGRATVARLCEEGQTVVNLDIAPPPPDAPGLYRQVDLGDEAATRRVLAEVCGEYAVLRVVNNAGVVFGKPFEQVTVEDLDRAVAVNLCGAIACVQAALPAMKAAGFGRIVNMSSRTVVGREHRTVYGMTKGGLLAMTKTWALELATSGITVNAIGPGPIGTELFYRGNPPDSPATKRLLKTVPMGRLGEPAEIAHAVAFFLDRRSSYVTGQMLFVCGGQTIGVQTV